MTTADKLRKEAKQEAAEKMLIKGYPIEDICEITGLSQDEVEKLEQKEMEH
jgi:predicted transposase/invertase (TIGR01784 family)